MKKSVIYCLISAFFILCLGLPAWSAQEKWPGVDETVVGKYAKENGRPPRASLLDLSGDALLFAFLVAGAVGGFALGYYYRDFTSKKSRREADAG